MKRFPAQIVLKLNESFIKSTKVIKEITTLLRLKKRNGQQNN